MNRLSGKIVMIERTENVALIDIDVAGDMFSTIFLHNFTDQNILTIDQKVDLIFKESEVSISKNLSGGLSLRNRMNSVILQVEQGKVLSKLYLDYKGNRIISIITTRSVASLDLNVGDRVEGLVKANEMTIMQEF